MTRAIFPGSFDPPHFGHLDVLKQASQTFDSVVWALAYNPEKKARFSVENRLFMMRSYLYMKPSSLSNVEIIAFDGLLVEAAKEFNVTHIVRSLRAEFDFAYEFQMTLVNRHLAPELTYVYFPAEQEHLHISSTVVRQLLAFKQDISMYVHQNVVDYLKRLA